MKFFDKLLKKEQGFTFAEALLSLSVFMIITVFLLHFLTTLLFRIYNQAIHPFEWENFIKQSQMELRQATDWEIEENTLTFTMADGRRATYSQHGSVLRKQVASRGHEILLQNVAQVHFRSIPNGVQLQITDRSGKVLTRNIVHVGGR